MHKIIAAFCVAGLLGGCGVTAVSDRYGNAYGGWYNPGANYRWQLDLCEQQMERQGIPETARSLAMRCCMRDHGVPIDDQQSCHA